MKYKVAKTNLDHSSFLCRVSHSTYDLFFALQGSRWISSGLVDLERKRLGTLASPLCSWVVVFSTFVQIQAEAYMLTLECSLVSR